MKSLIFSLAQILALAFCASLDASDFQNPPALIAMAEDLNSGHSHSPYQVNDSEVSEVLQDAFELLDFGPESLASLRSLQVALYRNNITQLYDIPQGREAVTDLLRGIPLDTVSLGLLEDGLGVKLPELDSTLLMGFGYNFQTDSVLPLSPFNLTAKKLSPIGFIIPSVYQLDVVNEMKEIFVLYRQSEEYYSSRFSFKESSSDSWSLTVSCWWFFCHTTGFKHQVGYNSERQSSLSGTNTTTEELSSAQEQRLFQLKLRSDPDINDLSTHFVERVRQLSTFEPRFCTSQSSWKHFFDSYGTHVVSSAYGGGSLNVVLRGNDLYQILKTSVETNGKDVTVMNFFHASSSEQLRLEENATLYVTNIYKAVSFKAGDPRFHKQDLFNIQEQEERNRIVEDWKNSIPQNPVMLDSNLELASLMDYIQVVDPTLKDILNYQAAVNYWLSGSLHTCEWYNSPPRLVTIWYDEDKDTGFPYDHPVRVVTQDGEMSGAPIPISALNLSVYFMCSEEERCRVMHVQEHCLPEDCPNKYFHLHYESEYTGGSINGA